ncbi:MAG TPA: hypothetical protein VMS04_15170, partial [Vicinamibacterales bacterium]|nr:hypothetical protein [Vicinamibacterales bacterium]
RPERRGRTTAEGRGPSPLRGDSPALDFHGSALSFGYFNTNNVDVAVTAGDANSFSPSPGDVGHRRGEEQQLEGDRPRRGQVISRG